MKVAIVYDRINKWGGAESVLLTLNEMYPEAPLFTSVYDEKKAPWAKVFPCVIPSFLQKIPFMHSKHELLGFLTPLAFEAFNFDEYDLVISVTSEAAKGIITKPQTKHICYCLTPTRYLWSHYDTYFKGFLFRLITKPIIAYLRKWDVVAAKRPDVMIAISRSVQSRIKKYYHRDSDIIYPPVNIEKFAKANLQQKNREKSYYLSGGRLVPYKKVDLAVAAFNNLGLPLIVFGSGSEEISLKLKAKKNIVFKGFVSDKELVKLFRGAKAFIFPGEEDFGIVMVEALASGTPVIAYNKGGASDIVEFGKTGILFDKQNKNSLIKAIKRFAKQNFNSGALVRKSKIFSKDNFKKDFMDESAKIIYRYR